MQLYKILTYLQRNVDCKAKALKELQMLKAQAAVAVSRPSQTALAQRKVRVQEHWSNQGSQPRLD
jgi:hypothetical protein